MIALAREISMNNLLKSNGIFDFQQKVKLRLETSSYVLKTADTSLELVESCKLRHEVFYREFQLADHIGVDVDQYDSHFDHLIIIHKESNKVIGTYRLSCSEFSSVSYTESEFDLTEIFKLKGPHLELGRACIQKEHRKGATVISLLWRGIVEYMNLSGANILYGCSSVKVESTHEAALIYKYFNEQGAILESNSAQPTSQFKMPDFAKIYSELPQNLSAEQVHFAESLIPSLLKFYIKFGAKIASEPAFDREFKCMDFLTIMKKEEISLSKKFQLIQ